MHGFIVGCALWRVGIQRWCRRLFRRLSELSLHVIKAHSIETWRRAKAVFPRRPFSPCAFCGQLCQGYCCRRCIPLGGSPWAKRLWRAACGLDPRWRTEAGAYQTPFPNLPTTLPVFEGASPSSRSPAKNPGGGGLAA